MKPDQNDLEDRLLDSLLHEQARVDQDLRLQEIERMLDRKISPQVRSRRFSRYGVAAAAVLALGGAWAVLKNPTKPEVREVAMQVPLAPEREQIADFSPKNGRSQLPILPVGHSRRMMSEGTQHYAIPEQGDNFGELSALSSLEVGEMSGGLGGLASNKPGGSGSGFGRGSGSGLGGSGGGVGFGLAPRPRIVPPPGSEGRAVLPENERYGSLVDPMWQRPREFPLSTFSIDVDNASYSNIRRMIRDGLSIPPDSVRIEECINAFDYAYEKPKGDQAFGVQTTLATCPWNEAHLLMKIGIKGREISPQQRPASNLVFLIDVSGSMQDPRKLPLVKESLAVLIDQLDERDSVSYVVYAGSEGVVLPPTKMTDSGRKQAVDALMRLEAGGSTNGGSGIQRAYQIARENFTQGGVNRVILASDGDFNVGITDRKQLVELVKERAADHIYLSVLSFGTGNLNDDLLESISKDGNGNYYYIDSIREGRRVFLQRLTGTLITIAKDVKIQVEFNPARVGSYRLIGYANRVLKSEDFNNDKVDAGDIGAGHTVTAFYEIIPAGSAGALDPLKYQKPAQAAPVAASEEWLTLKLRHKTPEGDISALQESAVKGAPLRWQDAGSDFSFASAVGLFAMKLRGMEDSVEFSWASIRELAQAGLANDASDDRAEFIGLLRSLEQSR